LFVATGALWCWALFYPDVHHGASSNYPYLVMWSYDLTRTECRGAFAMDRFYTKDSSGNILPMTPARFDGVYQIAKSGWSVYFRDKAENEEWMGFWGHFKAFGLRHIGIGDIWDKIWVIQVGFPFWFLMVLFGAAPGWELGAWVIQKRKKKPGHCVQCGYDLRAHHAGQKCPECGKVIGEAETGSCEIDIGGGI
jgi:hypothetical protein